MRLSTADGKPVWGVEWLTAQVNGQRVLNCINYRQEPVEVAVSVNGQDGRGQDLLASNRIEGSARLQPLEPVLLGLESASR
jgi:hypothetical protein